MSLQSIYENDLLTRFPGYSFSESAVGSMTRVQFLDGGMALVDESTKLVAADAYKTIRERVVGFAPAYPFFGPGVWITLDSSELQTTDDTQATIDAVTLPDETVMLFRIHVCGIEDDGSDRGAYIYTATIYRTGGGNATIEGSITEDHIGFSDSNWDVEITVSGNDARASVTGVSAETINWACSIQYMIL